MLLAEGPGIARGKKNEEKKFSNFSLSYNTPRVTHECPKNFSTFNPAVWPAIGNIYIQMSCFISEVLPISSVKISGK